MAQITINTEDMTEVGFDSNVLASRQGDLLVIVIDTTLNLGPSSSGKMDGVANTGGFQGFLGGLKGNVYIGRKR